MSNRRGNVSHKKKVDQTHPKRTKQGAEIKIGIRITEQTQKYKTRNNVDDVRCKTSIPT